MSNHDVVEAADVERLPDHSGPKGGGPWWGEPQAPPVGGATVDRAVDAVLGRLTMGVSPAAIGLAFDDWLVHLATSPGKQMELGMDAVGRMLAVSRSTLGGADDPEAPLVEPTRHDKRFLDPAWQAWPYAPVQQAFLHAEQWWRNATTGVRGVSAHHEAVVSFLTRQLLDVVAPSNNPATNPVVLRRTLDERGANLVRGWTHWMEDWQRALTGRAAGAADRFRPGHEVAVTPGVVVHRNELMELIQYSPTTEQVHAEPVLIVPAWIMKYYILDLRPENSLIRYLVDHGHTVFTISWKNPDASDRDLSMADYLRLGPDAALDAVTAITGSQRVHGVGYCLGGTLLAIAAAAMARDGDDRFATLTMLAAQVDFTEAGELLLFIDESQLAFLDGLMWAQGYLDSRQMAGTFQLLRSNDLVWSRMIHEYLMGERLDPNDLMAWSTDTTRMPYRMHSEYLRELFLDNDLAEGRYPVEGRPVALTDIRAPIFAVGTSKDHVAPWRSVYKIRLLARAPVTFLLTSGGHNTGIVTAPGHPRRIYQMTTADAGDNYVDPDSWRATAPVHKGSWWRSWQQWLLEHSSPVDVAPPPLGDEAAGHPVLADAPGTYVQGR